MRINAPCTPDHAIDISKLFTLQTLYLCLGGILLNFILGKAALFLGTGLYLDTVGTLFVAAVAGPLAGILTAFVSALLYSFAVPSLFLYFPIALLIALSASFFSRKQFLFPSWRCLIPVSVFVLLGGGLGGVITWVLAKNCASPGTPDIVRMVQPFVSQSFPEILLTHLRLDLYDKLITVALVLLLLRFFPRRLFALFPYGCFYAANSNTRRTADQSWHRKSVSAQIQWVIFVSSCLLGSLLVAYIGYAYVVKLESQYAEFTKSIARLAAHSVDGDTIKTFLDRREQTEDYKETKSHLQTIFANTESLVYLYVYQIKQDGCHVVFDMDTSHLPGKAIGDIVPFDDSLRDELPTLLAGGDITPVISNNKYGWLFTAYSAIKDSQGRTAAYAGVDISMRHFMQLNIDGLARLLMVTFALVILISAFILWFVERMVTRPLRLIVGHARELDEISPETWLESRAWKEKPEIRTGNEIEELYHSLCESQKNIALNVKTIKETEQEVIQSRELAKKNTALAAAVKRADEANSARSEFFTRISHDMRTPMHAIISFSAFGMESRDLAESNAFHTKIHKAGDFLLGLINESLRLSKLETGKFEFYPEPYPFSALTEDINDIVLARANAKHVHFFVQKDEEQEGSYCLLDKKAMQQIFVNLINNAIKFTPSGGHVRFICRKITGPEKTTIAEFSVLDDGIGMSEEFRTQRLFKPFEQENTLAGEEGTGLGLSIVKHLVDALGGSITCRSRQGEGTAFIIRLSVVCGETAASCDPVPQSKDVAVFKGLRVLLCEDHPLNREITLRLLGKKGISVENAVDGKQGLEKFRASPMYYYGAILMDIRMPVMDGLEATAAIRQLDRDDARTLPIIAMTANAFEDDIRKALDAGMNAHVSKPVNPNLLHNVLAQQIALAQAARAAKESL